MSLVIDSIQKLGLKSVDPAAENIGAMMFGKLGEIILPDELLEIYSVGDSIKFDSYPGRMIRFKDSKPWMNATFEETVCQYWPFFMADDCPSDLIGVFIHGPGTGYVIQRNHDGDDRVIAPDVATFFEMLASDPCSGDFFGDHEETWIYPRELTEQDRLVASEWLAKVTVAEDSYEGESLASLAMSMMLDDEFVAQFGKDLFPIRNFRAVVLGRLQRIDSADAITATQMYNDDLFPQ
jgi:hypothetical protein